MILDGEVKATWGAKTMIIGSGAVFGLAESFLGRPRLMNVFGIGLPELAVIAAIGLLVFGPKRLPELGKTLGRTLKGFQSASSEFEKELRTAITTAEPLAADLPVAVSATELVSADASGADAPELIEQPLDGPAA